MTVRALDGDGVQTRDKAALGVLKALPVAKIKRLLNTFLGVSGVFGGWLGLGQMLR